MRRIFAYIFATMALAACNSSEELFVEDVQEQTQDVDSTGVYVTREELKSSRGIGSRSILYYDKLTNSNAALFGWEDDHLAVYSYGQPNFIQPIDFKQVEGQAGSSLSRVFTSNSDGVKALPGFMQYIAFMPQGETETVKPKANSYLVEVTYRNQIQQDNVDMRYYFALTEKSGENYEQYLESEKSASGHLGAYDYLCSAPTTTRAHGGIDFDLKRLGAVVRFYIKYPAENMVYTDLQLYNGTEVFALDANVNVSSMSMEPTATSHVMNLKLGENGFDIGSYGDNNNFYNINNKKAYLIAYMMLAPVNLEGDGKDKSMLYLIAHEKGDPETKHYYKAELGAKPNLAANIFHQWAPTQGDDNPIEFTETNVEEWEQTAGLENNGAGTGSW